MTWETNESQVLPPFCALRHGAREVPGGPGRWWCSSVPCLAVKTRRRPRGRPDDGRSVLGCRHQARRRAGDIAAATPARRRFPARREPTDPVFRDGTEHAPQLRINADVAARPTGIEAI